MPIPSAMASLAVSGEAMTIRTHAIASKPQNSLTDKLVPPLPGTARALRLSLSAELARRSPEEAQRRAVVSYKVQAAVIAQAPDFQATYSVAEPTEDTDSDSEDDDMDTREDMAVFTASYPKPRVNSGGQGGTQMLAAVDLGTNSFHMVVVKADDRGNFQIQDVEKEDVRLGSGSAGFSVIAPDAEERAVAAIKRLKKIALTRGAKMRVVATSAVREARNRRAFVRRLLDAAGVDVEVLSGREEACLIYLGILQAMPVYHRTVLTVDIGGGSTEFVIGRKGQPLLATSLKLGHIRLTERFASGNVLNKADLEEMRRYVRVILNDSGVVEAVKSLQGDIEVAIGSSGTIETLEQMIQEREFTREQLSAIVKKLCKAKTAEQRAKIPGLPEKRVDVIVGGAILLEEIFLALGIRSMKVSPYALREGVIVDTLSRTVDNFALTTDLRRTSIMNLAQKYNTEKRLDSALHSAELAKQIRAGLLTCKVGGVDCLSPAVHLLDMETDSAVMEAATILHYVGMFISHKGYHKHSYYLIKHAEQLLGYTPMEVEMIALLVRYHRKKVPSSKDQDLQKLPEELREKIRVLTAIIRIAVALDRCDTGAVEKVLVLQDDESCVLAVTPARDPKTGALKDVSLEIWAARAELEYFQKIFKKTATIVLVDDLDAETIDVEPSASLSS